ncbi:mandelate racemase/muconate lactonizing enzyme family protein [Actinoallomurus purpureus]|uniref:mandelate racemase/muconate lactonizing enzyme family protein n=1 Tax=Actinoallomurus purpureus TaxID=478114 RepID=UPI002092804D|nr:mandelate racemase/muconate lactonizing enzyme family protein [Actinoallomurus purpureus]MCO6003495.1 mandelate racemase/muconate lactonizing enzyme family protein [Actinoallomurus purpureus]
MGLDDSADAFGVLSPPLVDLPRGDAGAVITSVETYALAVPLKQPIADSTASLRSWIVPVVEIRTADGRVGTGISGVHCAPELLCDVISRYYAPSLLGAASEDILGTWKRLYWLPTHWLGRAGAVHMALAMVDIALWDLAAQRAGVPLWRLLGGSAEAIETYNTDGGWLNYPVDTLVRDLTSLIDRGWRRVKIKVGKPDWREDAHRVRAVRRAIGDGITLMCDANQRWDLSTAGRLLPALEEVGMDWIEEPLHADALDGHARLQRATRVDIAAGESLYSYHHFASFIAADAIRVVQVDVTRVGGVTEWLQVAHHAAAHGLRIAPHAGDMMQVHQHLVGTALSDVPPLVEFIPWTQDAFEQRSVVNEGYLERPQLPGASTAVHRDARRDWQIRGVGHVTDQGGTVAKPRRSRTTETRNEGEDQ